MTNSKDLQPVRRVVTGHNAQAIARVLIDGPATNKRAGSASTLIWCSDATPADISIGEDIEDLGGRILGTPPPPNGTRFTINDMQPGNTPVMHRTETLDYAIVLSGEVDLELDDSKTTLKQGDVVIQRGTNHAWANRGT
jgi:hypothetical protein